MDDIKNKKGDFWDILNIVVKWRRLLVVNFIAAAVITFAIASFLPKMYTSNATLFPPEKDSGSLNLASSLLGSGLGSLLSGGGGMSLPSFTSLSDVYAAILLSRAVAEEVIDKNDLQEVYEIKSREKTIQMLSSRLKVLVQPEGMISISCEDRDPNRAADIVGSFIETLNDINARARSSKASATRKFIEERLDQTKVDLAAAEDEYKTFQEKNQTISLPDQVSAMIDNLATLKSQEVMARVELGVLKRTFLPDHMQVKQQEAKVEEIEKQIGILEKGIPGADKTNPLSIPFSEAPTLGLELARLTRNLKIQETIFQLLTEQYEQAKIQEMRDTPTIQVLNAPSVPERKSSPKRAIMGIMAGFLAFLLTVIAVFIKEFIDRSKEANTPTYKNLEGILDVLRKDFYAFRSLFAGKSET